MLAIVFIELGILIGLAGFLAGGRISDWSTRRSVRRSPLGASLSYRNYEQDVRHGQGLVPPPNPGVTSRGDSA